VLSAALVVASLGPPKTAAAALRQQEQHAKRLPGGLPGGAAGLLASGGLLNSLGGSLMTGSAGSNGSVAVSAHSAAAPAFSETASVLGRELPAWATKSAGHGGSALGDKTGSLHFVGAILLDDMKQVIRL